MNILDKIVIQKKNHYKYLVQKIKKTKLKNLNLKNPDIKKDIKNLGAQKNQLEIEKQELEEKYKSLVDDYNNLSKKLYFL